MSAPSSAGPGPSREAVRLLARPRSAADRLRSRATAAASAGTGVALLLLAAVLGLGDDPATTGVEVVQAADGSTVWTAVTPTDGLVPFLAEPGLRPGVQLGALLLVLPFLALAVQALRVGAVARQQREATLVVVGASPRDLRRVRTRSTAADAFRGGLYAAPAYLAAWLLLGVAAPLGARLVPVPEPWLALVWVVLVGVLTAAGAAAGALLGRRGAASRPAPPARWAWGWGAAGAACLGFLLLGSQLPWTLSEDLLTFAAYALLLGVLLCLAAGAVVVLARAAVRSSARRVERAARAGVGAEAVLAAAQRRANPIAVGASGAVLVLVGVCVGVCVVFVIALAVSRELDGTFAGDIAFYGGGAVLACAVAAVAAAVALVSLALALTDHLAQARRAVAATAALGCDVPRLVEVQARALAATAVPSAVVGTLVGGLAYGGLQAYLDWTWLGARTLVAVAAVPVAAVVVGAAVRLVACAVAELLTGRVRRAAALENLRTP